MARLPYDFNTLLLFCTSSHQSMAQGRNNPMTIKRTQVIVRNKTSNLTLAIPKGNKAVWTLMDARLTFAAFDGV